MSGYHGGDDNDSCVNQDTGQIHWLHFPANLNVMDGAANIRVDRAEAVIYGGERRLNTEHKIRNKNTYILHSTSTSSENGNIYLFELKHFYNLLARVTRANNQHL